MNRVRAKKHLGQHFLLDKGIAGKTADSLLNKDCTSVLEIGPGMGVLTTFLVDMDLPDLRVIEIDGESINYLEENFKGLNIINGDFLKYDIESNFSGSLAIIGNFPFNISSQIFFRVLENRNKVVELTGMIQKEVAERICSGPGSKAYGILSVLLQTYYDIEYLFTVPPTVFKPQPKVTSAVIRLIRNDRIAPGCDEKLLFRVVKSTFNHRRKMIRNSIKAVVDPGESSFGLLTKRPEQLGLDDYIELTNWAQENMN